MCRYFQIPVANLQGVVGGPAAEIGESSPPLADGPSDEPPRLFFRLVQTKPTGKFLKICPASGCSRLNQKDLVIAVLQSVKGEPGTNYVSMQPVVQEVGSVANADV